MQNTNSYQTRDLYFSAYLFSKGYKLLSVDFDNGGFYWFTFEEKEKCEKEDLSFQKNEALVNAKEYSDAIKYLKRKVSVPQSVYKGGKYEY